MTFSQLGDYSTLKIYITGPCKLHFFKRKCIKKLSASTPLRVLTVRLLSCLTTTTPKGDIVAPERVMSILISSLTAKKGETVQERET